MSEDILAMYNLQLADVQQELASLQVILTTLTNAGADQIYIDQVNAKIASDQAKIDSYNALIQLETANIAAMTSADSLAVEAVLGVPRPDLKPDVDALTNILTPDQMKIVLL